MILKELIEKLKGFDENKKVVLSFLDLDFESGNAVFDKISIGEEFLYPIRNGDRFNEEVIMTIGRTASSQGYATHYEHGKCESTTNILTKVKHHTIKTLLEEIIKIDFDLDTRVQLDYDDTEGKWYVNEINDIFERDGVVIIAN